MVAHLRKLTITFWIPGPNKGAAAPHLSTLHHISLELTDLDRCDQEQTQHQNHTALDWGGFFSPAGLFEPYDGTDSKRVLILNSKYPIYVLMSISSLMLLCPLSQLGSFVTRSCGWTIQCRACWKPGLLPTERETDWLKKGIELAKYRYKQHIDNSNVTCGKASGLWSNQQVRPHSAWHLKQLLCTLRLSKQQRDCRSFRARGAEAVSYATAALGGINHKEAQHQQGCRSR